MKALKVMNAVMVALLWAWNAEKEILFVVKWQNLTLKISKLTKAAYVVWSFIS